MATSDVEGTNGSPKTEGGVAAPPYEAVSFQIISFAGTAKSCYLEAIECAKRGEDPAELIAQGDEAYEAASRAHQEALQMEANGTLGSGLLLIHAESILISAETIKNLMLTIIELVQASR